MAAELWLHMWCGEDSREEATLDVSGAETFKWEHEVAIKTKEANTLTDEERKKAFDKDKVEVMVCPTLLHLLLVKITVESLGMSVTAENVPAWAPSPASLPSSAWWTLVWRGC